MPELMNEDEIFTQWLRSCLSAERDPIRRPEQAKPYEWIWKSWCRWLATPPAGSTVRRADNWRAPTHGQVMGFIASGPTAAASKRKGKSAAISKVTQRRYWRVLQRVYGFAVERGQLEANPANIPEEERELAGEWAAGVVLPPALWQQLQLLMPAGDHWLDVRDRAILRLFMELALTPEEVVTLPAPGRDLLDPSKIVVHVNGSKDRPWQERTLQPSPALLEDLLAWHRCRERLEPGQMVGPHWFLSMRLTPMTRRSLFHLVAPRVAAAAKLAGVATPAHVGPMVLRNTRILQWLRHGRPIAQVLADAGLREAKNLARITVHLTSAKYSGYAAEASK